MRLYFDTTAMVRAFKMDVQPSGVTRAHTLSEFYSTLTGAGILGFVEGRETKEKFSPTQAAAAARETFSEVKFVDLTADDIFGWLKTAAAQNVQGRNIHDWLHCAAAQKAKCDAIVTMNFSDFSPMTDLPLISPTKQFSARV